mgnify:CR=1 FL=1
MDKYTKGILTVIAICLVSITFQLSKTDVIEKAHANQPGYNMYNPIWVKHANKCG